MTTMAIGEEGQDCGMPVQEPTKTAKETHKVTTKAIGEEGQDCGHPHPPIKDEIELPPTDRPTPTTLRVGEEGQDFGQLPRPFNMKP